MDFCLKSAFGSSVPSHENRRIQIIAGWPLAPIFLAPNDGDSFGTTRFYSFYNSDVIVFDKAIFLPLHPMTTTNEQTVQNPSSPMTDDDDVKTVATADSSYTEGSPEQKKETAKPKVVPKKKRKKYFKGGTYKLGVRGGAYPGKSKASGTKHYKIRSGPFAYNNRR